MSKYHQLLKEYQEYYEGNYTWNDFMESMLMQYDDLTEEDFEL